MKESAVREKHQNDMLKAFHDSGCKFFPGTQTVARYLGQSFLEHLDKTGHSAMGFDSCKCKQLVTMTNAQEWEEHRHKYHK